MPRFLVRPEAISGDRVLFDAEETHHLARVLRLGPGDLVRALDGRGAELTVRLIAVEPRAASGAVVGRALVAAESSLELTLAQGVPRGDRMEAIVRMATELGATCIAPLLTARTVVRLDEAAGRAGRHRRWQRVARESAKQSGRAVVPAVEAPRALPEWLVARPRADLLVCLWEGERRALDEVLPPGPVHTAAVVVGPEGGLSEGEVEALVAAGAVRARLGPRILRTETAGPVGLALLQARYGDLTRVPMDRGVAPEISP
jgi:16S rRNA (uracil1498-N3)-methyltransferase